MTKKSLIALFIISMLTLGMSAAEDDEANTILETATADGNFSTLVGDIEAAGLTEVLSGEGPFTVFAPTDTAFSAVWGLELIDTEMLSDILKYHTISGILTAEDIVTMTSIHTLQGGNLTINATDEGLMVNKANVTTKDILCSNGVIHVIDAVMMPPSVGEFLERERLEEERQEQELRQQELEDRLEEERVKRIQEKVLPSQLGDLI